jgi:hypothetical protein
MGAGSLIGHPKASSFTLSKKAAFGVRSTQLDALSPLFCSMPARKSVDFQPRYWAMPRVTGFSARVRLEMCSRSAPLGFNRSRYRLAHSAVSRCSGMESLEKASTAIRS